MRCIYICRYVGEFSILVMTAAPCRTIFDTLYMLLAFGHETEEMGQRLDPPASYFRVRLVCVLLEAVWRVLSQWKCCTSPGSLPDRFPTLCVYQSHHPPTDVEFDLQVSLRVLCMMFCTLLLKYHLEH